MRFEYTFSISMIDLDVNFLYFVTVNRDDCNRHVDSFSISRLFGSVGI